jgi:hypothetical protein
MPKKQSLEERFWGKVAVKGPEEPTEKMIEEGRCQDGEPGYSGSVWPKTVIATAYRQMLSAATD